MVMKLGLICCVIVGAGFTVSAKCQAQPILMGVTAAVAGTGPQPTNRLVDVDTQTGIVSNSRDLGIAVMSGIATQPSTGSLYGLTSWASNPVSSLIQIDPLTGAVNVIGPTGLPLLIEGDLAFNPLNGMLYGLQDVGTSVSFRNLFQINPLTGAATIVGDVGTIGNTVDYSGLAFNANGILYALDVSGGGGLGRLMTIDPNNAQVTSMITTNINFGGAAGLAFHPETGVAYLADTASSGTNSVYTLDVNTGFATLIGPTGDPHGLAGLAFIPVPEPSSVLLVGFGTLVGLSRVMRMRKIKQAGTDAPA